MTTVLIVEDNPVNVRVFSRILKKKGHLDVLCSEDVGEIIDLTASGQVDLILMDVSLTASFHEGKSVDGIRITQMLKQNPGTQRVPVVLVTAHAMQGDREAFLSQSGAEGYISKPVVDYEDFLAQIRGLISS